MEHSPTAPTAAPTAATATATAPVSDQLAPLRAAIHELVELDPSLRCDRQSIIELERLRSQLDYVVSTSVASFDQWGGFTFDGAQTAVAWIDTACHLPKAEARAQLRRGRAFSGLPLAAAAFSAGEIGAAQVDVLVKAKNPVTEEAMARDEALLVGYAKDMKFAPFCNAVAYWEQLADQDGSEEAAWARKERRDVYLVAALHGMFLGKMTLDPIGGAIVANELAVLEKEFFDADWAKAKERLGREPHIDELDRTPAGRRADALVEMATRSAGARGHEGRRPEPLFTVLVDYPTLAGRICQLEQGPALTPGSLVPYFDEATFERIVFAPGKRIECSPTARLFTGATRRAIEVRDQQCCHEYCDRSAEQCQIDHIVPWSEGGLTIQENGQVLCEFHNRARYERPPPGG
jgi:hypothetical protein